jgi:G:T-mismatch repair DNA endonuclease (very short patch repair protein)
MPCFYPCQGAYTELWIVTRKSHHLAKRQSRKKPTNASKRQPRVMNRQQNFMGRKAPSQPDMVIGNKKAGVQIFECFWILVGRCGAKSSAGIDQIRLS